MATVVLGPGQLDVAGIRAGDVNVIQVEVINHVDQSPVPLDGYTLTSQVRSAVTDVDPLMAAVVTILDAPNGVVLVQWDGETVRAVLGDKARVSGVWDLQMEIGGQVVTIVAGSWTAEMDVTR